MLYNLSITGWGYYLPEKIETANELAKKINKTPKWISTRSGVDERRISKIDVDKMGAIAAKNAIQEKPPPDLIINASGVPKQTIPDTSVFIQKELGYKGIPSFSIHSTCLSFLTALNVAGSFIESKTYKNILIVSSDRGTIGRNYNEPESASLLGDAAAAIYIEPSRKPQKGILDFKMNSWPEGANLTEVRGGGTNLHPQNPNTKNEDNLFSMKGSQIFRLSVPKTYQLILEILKKNQLKQSDIDFVIPHQASGKGVLAYSKFGGFKKNQVINIISKTGNCVAASLPLALSMSLENNKISSNNLIMLIGTGAGLSIGASIIKI